MKKISREISDSRGNVWKIALKKHEKYTNRFLSYVEINGSEFDLMMYYSIKSARAFWRTVCVLLKDSDQDFDDLISERKRKKTENEKIEEQHKEINNAIPKIQCIPRKDNIT